MLYNECLYDSCLYSGLNYTGTWEKSYSFTYLAGTTVSITIDIVKSVPEGTTLEIYAGESLSSMVLIPGSTKTAVLFISTTSGATNLYIRAIFTRTSSVSPVLTSLNLTIEQESSLYTIASSILNDALTPSNSQWVIDTDLQKYLIPYSWFNPVDHRKAISKVAEACGGVVYQDRYGIVTVEAADYLQRSITGTALDTINEDRILNAASPVSDVRNRIQIQTSPYIAKASPEKIWELSGINTINNSEQKTYDIVFQDYDAAIDCSATLGSTPSGATIISEEYFSFGGTIVIEGSSDAQAITLEVEGTPLIQSGIELIERTDGNSIRRNGDRALIIMDNPLIQNSLVAGIIADDILTVTKNESRDINLDWRGDPTLELGDEVSIDGVHGVIITQEFSFNGALSAKMQVRKV